MCLRGGWSRTPVARTVAAPRIMDGRKRDDDEAVAGKDWKVVIADEYARRSGVYAAPDETSFPLIASSIFSEEILRRRGLHAQRTAHDGEQRA